MSTVGSVGATGAGSAFLPQSSSDPVTVATALTALRLKTSSTVVITDSLQNILQNLDALQKVFAKITSLTTTDQTQTLSVNATQYAKDSAILAIWGAGEGNALEVTGVKAASAAALVAAAPSYVSTIRVADSSANLQKNLDTLQTLAADAVLTQIVQTGSASTLKITAAQLSADQDALALIKNQAYALAITEASVAETLGLDGETALTANAKIKSIDVKDTTDAIETNLDALQRVGLRLKSISQTDADSPITLTGSQYLQDTKVLGKIITSYQLAVIRAATAQATGLTANDRVVTVSIADTAANITKKWGLLQRLVDGLTAVEVTDPASAITLTGDQLAQSESLLAKFTDDSEHTYKLTVAGVAAGSARAVAEVDHVQSLAIADSAANVAANFADILAINDLGLLSGITLTGKIQTLSMDASRLQGDELTATQDVLSRISGGNYGLAVTGVSLASLDDLASNAHVVSMEVGGSSAQIGTNLDSLYQLGKKVTKIQQSDNGAAIDVTQSTFESRASVLAKIEGGYTVNVSGVTANKILADALNVHVAQVSVADNGKNLVSHWDDLLSLGSALEGVAKTDDGSLALSFSQYRDALDAQMAEKFDTNLKFAVSNASATEAAEIGSDEAVESIDVTDESSAITDQLSELETLRTGGKLNSITLSTSSTSLALHASQLEDAQGVLDLIKGGLYTLAVDQVDVADAKALVDANAKVATLQVTGDATGIVDHLADLAAVGHKLVSVTQSDAADTALRLTGSAFEQNKGTLAKIAGGYLADLTDVAAARAATLAASTRVKSLEVADTGEHLAATWDTLGTLGAKLTDIAQSDSTVLQLTMKRWTAAPGLAGKFSTTPAVAVAGASVADVASLSADEAVQGIQVTDSASAIEAALDSLADETKLTELQLTDPATAIAMTAETFSASADLLALVKDGSYKVALSAVAVEDAATIGADAHVSTMGVVGASSDIAASFDALSALTNLSSLALSDAGGSLSLSSAQILGGADTLAKIANSYQLAATGVAVADLADIEAIQEVATIGISDTAENVSANFDDLLSLGGSLASLHLSDDTPVLSLVHEDWAAGTAALAKIDGSYQVDLTEVTASDAQNLGADSTIRQISVADTAGDIANSWSALISLYDAGNGKLVGLSFTDAEPLTLTAQQQTDGAAMIDALLSDATIVTAS